MKFEDSLLLTDLVSWAEEIFPLEMKLRRILTRIYLPAYQNGEPYDLPREEDERPMTKEKLTKDQMKKNAENPFFYLTFSQYGKLNKRPEINKFPALPDSIRDAETYDAFRAEINRLPVEDERDKDLLKGLEERMGAIEALRNRVAPPPVRASSGKLQERSTPAR